MNTATGSETGGSSEAHAKAEAASRSADASLRSALLLLDHREFADAALCGRRAAELKMRAMLHMASDPRAVGAEVLGAFVERFGGTELWDDELRSPLAALMRSDAVAPADQPPPDAMSPAALRALRRFFLACNQFLRGTRRGGVRMPPPGPTADGSRPAAASTASRVADHAPPQESAPEKRRSRYFTRGVITVSTLVVAAGFGIVAWYAHSRHAHTAAPQWDISTLLREHPSGLLGVYFADINPPREQGMRDAVVARVDPVIAFDWHAEPPDSALPLENYAVRWTGRILADEDGDYEFITESDDGVQLWVDRRQLINDWSLHGLEERSGVVHLKKGWHPIRLNYHQRSGNAAVQLLWKGPSKQRESIPRDHLVPAEP